MSHIVTRNVSSAQYMLSYAGRARNVNGYSQSAKDTAYNAVTLLGELVATNDNLNDLREGHESIRVLIENIADVLSQLLEDLQDANIIK
jgi:hypothetical protein